VPSSAITTISVSPAWAPPLAHAIRSPWGRPRRRIVGHPGGRAPSDLGVDDRPERGATSGSIDAQVIQRVSGQARSIRRPARARKDDLSPIGRLGRLVMHRERLD
jgi:hypothetical protein